MQEMRPFSLQYRHRVIQIKTHSTAPPPPLHNPPRRLHFRFTNSRPIHLTAGSNGTLIQLFKSTLPLQSLSESTQHPFGRLPPKEPIRRLLAVAKRISRPTQIRKPATPTQNVNTSIRSVGCVCVCTPELWPWPSAQCTQLESAMA